MEFLFYFITLPNFMLLLYSIKTTLIFWNLLTKLKYLLNWECKVIVLLNQCIR